MKNGKHGVIAQIAGPGLVLAALLATVLSNPGIGRAQTSTASPAVTTAKSSGPLANSPVQSAAKPPAKGQSEGIHVHGHWTIEVHNPDGKLFSHTEFENALVQPAGAETLALQILGYLPTGGYLVNLADSTRSHIGPCAAINNNDTSCYLIGSLVSPEPGGFGDGSSACGGTGSKNQITPTGPCFPLSVSGIPSTGSNGDPSSLAFSGTAVANSTTPITDVFLNSVLCYDSSTPAQGGSTVSANACAQGQAQTEAYLLTHATLPTSVQIAAAGQLISVNVQISFQ